MSLLSELRRRNVFRVAATYVIASWLIIQVVTSVSAPLNLPEWFDGAVIVLLAIGFPVAILLAWAFELTPEGIKISVSGETKSEAAQWRLTDAVLAVSLIAVAAIMAWSQFGPRGQSSNDALAVIPEKSIAVLPFADMSPEGDQEYFGDGIAEEIIDDLTSLSGLRVASRTSSFGYRGRQTNALEIGDELNVSTILEGSVRKSGDRLRITAQLINVQDGFHLWSKTFEREVSDIFAIQDEIAAEVTGALGISLDVGDVNAFRGAGTSSVEAYEAYLRAMRPGNSERKLFLQQAVQLDPEYGAALAALGLAIAATRWDRPPESSPKIHAEAFEILTRAIQLDPGSAYAHSLHATLNYGAFKWSQSERHFQRGLEIKRSGNLLSRYGHLHMRSGRSSSAISLYQASTLEHLYPQPVGSLNLNAYLALERFAEVEDFVANEIRSPVTRQRNVNFLLAVNRADRQKVKQALAESATIDVSIARNFASLLRDFDSTEAALESLRSLYADETAVWPSKYHDIALLAAFFGDPEFALEVFSVEVRLLTVRYGALWYPVMAEARRLPAFKTLLSEVNLVDYWREYGWPDHCRPLDKEDFECF
jgi:TolB-like protein